MARIADINVAKWMELLATVQRSGGGCYGTLAAAAMVRALTTNVRAQVDGLPNIPAVQRAINPVRDELALLEARTESYVTRLADVQNPSTIDDRIACERISGWLMTGVTPDELPPVLTMGDGRRAALLWNQVAPVAAAEAETIEGHPFPDAFTTMRELIANTETAFSTAAPGEVPSARDRVVTTLEAARDHVAELVTAAGNDLRTIAKWFGIAVALLAVAYLVWKARSK